MYKIYDKYGALYGPYPSINLDEIFIRIKNNISSDKYPVDIELDEGHYDYYNRLTLSDGTITNIDLDINSIRCIYANKRIGYTHIDLKTCLEFNNILFQRITFSATQSLFPTLRDTSSFTFDRCIFCDAFNLNNATIHIYNSILFAQFSINFGVVYLSNNYYYDVIPFYGKTYMDLYSSNDVYYQQDKELTNFGFGSAYVSHGVCLNGVNFPWSRDPIVLLSIEEIEKYLMPFYLDISFVHLKTKPLYILNKENSPLIKSGIVSNYVSIQQKDIFGNDCVIDRKIDRGLVAYISSAPIETVYSFKIINEHPQTKVTLSPSGNKYRLNDTVTINVDPPAGYLTRLITVQGIPTVWNLDKWKNEKIFTITEPPFSKYGDNIINVEVVPDYHAKIYSITPLSIYNDVDNVIIIKCFNITHVVKIHVGNTGYDIYSMPGVIEFVIPAGLLEGNYPILIQYALDITGDLEDTGMMLSVATRALSISSYNMWGYINSTLLDTYIMDESIKNQWEFITSPFYIKNTYVRWQEIVFEAFMEHGSCIEVYYSINNSKTFTLLKGFVGREPFFSKIYEWKTFKVNLNKVSEYLTLKFNSRGVKIRNIQVGYMPHSLVRSVM